MQVLELNPTPTTSPKTHPPKPKPVNYNMSLNPEPENPKTLNPEPKLKLPGSDKADTRSREHHVEPTPVAQEADLTLALGREKWVLRIRNSKRAWVLECFGAYMGL